MYPVPQKKSSILFAVPIAKELVLFKTFGIVLLVVLLFLFHDHAIGYKLSRG